MLTAAGPLSKGVATSIVVSILHERREAIENYLVSGTIDPNSYLSQNGLSQNGYGTACPQSCRSCSVLRMGFFGFVSTVGISGSKDFCSSSPTSVRVSSTGSMSSPRRTVSRFRVVVGLLSSDALCQIRFPTLDRFSQNSTQHLSHCVFLQTSLPDSCRNWECHSRDTLE